MSNASVRAVPELLTLDERVPSAHTTVYYQRQYVTDAIWERIGSASWKHVDLNRRAVENDGWELRGAFSSPAIFAGDRYEVVVSQLDPNDSPLSDSPLPTTWCIGIGARAAIHQDSRFGFGGTWIGASTYPHQQVDITVEIGQASPDTFPDGHQEFDPATRLHRSLHTDITWLSETYQDLWILPGTAYWILVRVVDEHGQWDEVLGSIRTLRRRVQIRGTRLVVHNDGDPGGTGECTFFVSLREAGVGERLSWQRQEADISDGAVLDLRGQFDFDSGLVAGGGSAFRLHLGGVEDDSDIEGGDETVLGTDTWWLPRGKGYESLAPISWIVRADTGHPDDDFEFSVELTRAVDYA